MRTTAVTVAVVVCFLAIGCVSPPTGRLNAPPQGQSARPHELQEPYIQMTDSAMLADLSVCDIHFVPHSDQINSLGERRLDRCVEMLKEYGGKLRYESQTRDGALIRKRLAGLREFLEASGVELDKVKVVNDLSGGRGVPAEEAVAALEASRSCGQDGAGAIEFSSLLSTGIGGN